MPHAMQRVLLGGGDLSCAECQNLNHPAVAASDWVGFLALFGSSFILIWKLMGFRGPEGDDKYYMGYRESKMMSVFVNLFAAMAYWAKLASHANHNEGPAANVVTYKYLDYVLTCPLLTADLLWALNLPYKFTYAGFVAVCIVCAFMATTIPAPAKFMWFGMGFTLFMYTWYNILMLVKMRLDQMVNKRVKRVKYYLKMACTTYFAIWIGYPTLWVMYEAGIIDTVTSHVLHVLFDVIAKSVYGFALLCFVLAGDKHDIVFLELKPTVERDELDSDDEDAKAAEDRQQVVIGSKKAKHALKSSRIRESAMSESDFPNYNDFGTMYALTAVGNTHPEISTTQAEIMQLNKQLETLMSREQARLAL